MFSSRSIANYFFIAAAIATLGILSAAAALYFLVVQPGTGAAIAHSERESARSYVAMFNSRSTMLRRQTEHLARLPETVAALAKTPQEGLRAIEQRLTRSIDRMRAVRLFRADIARADLSVNPPVKFSAIELVRAAEQGALVHPEVHRHDGKLLIYFAVAVIDPTGRTLGSVLTITDGAYFERAIETLEPGTARVLLRQQFENLPAVAILEVGNRNATERPITETLAVPTWRAEYFPGDRQFDTLAPLSNTRLLPILGLVLVAAIGGIFLAQVRLSRVLERDLQLLPKTLRERSGQERMQLAALEQAVDETLKAIPPSHGARVTARSRARQLPAEGPIPIDQTEEVELHLDDPLDDDDFLDITSDPEPDATPEETSDTDFRFDDTQAGEMDFTDAPALEELLPETTEIPDNGLDLDPSIFRAYDIRGIVDQSLTGDVIHAIGQAFGSEALDANHDQVVVGADGRLSSPELRTALIDGLTSTGINVIDIGEVPTPLLYYATHRLATGTGVQITGSHSPPEYNGVKMVLGNEALSEARILGLRRRIEESNFRSGDGSVSQMALEPSYIDEIANDIAIAQSLRVVVDGGNGVAGPLATDLLRSLGCEVVEVHCQIDGTFPNHHPDPNVADNLQDLIEAVATEGADLGIAFDGDGDRLGVVTGSGAIIWPDRLMMLFARDIVIRNPGTDIVYDVKCSRHLNNLITEYGGRPIMWKTGHSNIKSKVRETGALLGGEFSGHICFLERWYGFDDGLYAAARLLEIVGSQTETLDDLMAEFPDPISTGEIKIDSDDQTKFALINELAKSGDFEGGTINDVDGLRIEFVDGWGLVRASNTGPQLTLRFEADDQAGLERIAGIVQRELSRLDPNLRFSAN